MAPKQLLITLLVLCIFTTVQSQSCTSDSDCQSGQICGIDPKQCFKRFNITDYAEYSATTGSAPPPPGDSSTSIDFTQLLDADISSHIEFSGGSFIFLDLVFPGETGYWVHRIDIVLSNLPTGLGLYINGYGNQHSSYTQNIVNPRTYYTFTGINGSYPIFVKNLTIQFAEYLTFQFYSIDVYGAYNSPEPTVAPTASPTDVSQSPTKAPTPAPTDNPTPAPTGYPTPNVCDEFMVTQNCCGNHGFSIQSDKINLRDASLTTCNYTFEAGCCGTVGGWTIASSKTAWGCQNQLDSNICDPSFWDSSVNTTDKIFGPVVTAEDNDWAHYLSITSVPIADLRDESLNYCTCNWTVYECAGTDEAVCGAQSDYDNLFALDCWGNETWTISDPWRNESCFQDNKADYEFLLYEPCSLDSFLGSVTSVDYISSETILDDGCTCQYDVRNCRVLEDPAPAEPCIEEVANPCCTSEIDYYYKNFTGVNYTLDSNTGKPLDNGWSCKNGMDFCPDLWDGSFKFTSEYRVDWWYDNNKIHSICGCLYDKDICNLPTKSPSKTPSSAPTQPPTSGPTAPQGNGAMETRLAFGVFAIIIWSIGSLL